MKKYERYRLQHNEDMRGRKDPHTEEVSEMIQVTMHTDGACSGNPGPGGWAAVLQWNGHEKEVAGGATESTNNQAELSAVIIGLEALKRPCKVAVYTDSQYVIGVMSKGWKRKANHLLLVALDALCKEHEVKFAHVRGHAGNELNERADRLAKAEVERQRSRLSAQV